MTPKLTRCSLVLLLMLMSTFSLTAQLKTVTGVVTNSETRLPMQGVTVGIKGSSKNTMTNVDGKYTISVSGNETVLKFTSVGFGYQEKAVGAQSDISVFLEKDDKLMDDVIVVGYGTVKKSNSLAAVSTIKSAELEDLPVTNLAASLQGRFPAVAVSGGTSRPGSNASITIRNPITLTKDAGGTLLPLYVIDDVIRSEDDFNILDPTEVEDITVLKDAAAAVYGVRSAQGVIVVRTKRGKAGKTQINFNSSYAINDATQLPKMMTGYELANYLNTSTKTKRNFIADGTSGYLADAAYYTDDELAYFKDNNTDWLKMAWKPSHLMRHALNVSGGSDKATFFAGGSYVKQDGNLDKISQEKWTFRASADVKLSQGLKVGLSVNGDLSKKEQYLLKQGGENPENDLKGLTYTPGFTPAYINGFPVRLSTASNQNTIDAFHFFEAQRLNNYNRSNDNGLSVTANVEYQLPFLKGLTAKVQYSKIFDNTYPKQFGTKYKLYSFNMIGGHNHIYTNTLASQPPVTASNGDRIYLKPSTLDRYQLNASLGYSAKVGKHEFSALAIVEQAEAFYNDVQAITETPIDGAPDNSRFAFGAQTVFETQTETGNLGYIGRANYGFNNKYLAEFAFRYDASTNFSPENRWGFFYSMAAGWVLSEEGFFKGSGMSNTVNYMKFRASLGHLGTDQVKPYSYQQRYTPVANGGTVFGGNNTSPISVGTKPENMPNPDASWDDYLKYNAGIDARFLKNKLSLSVDAFYNHGYNLLTSLSSSVPLIVGSPITPENYSTVNGFGTELSLGWRDNISKDISYNIGGFFSWSDNNQVKVDVQKGLIGTYEDPFGRSSDLGFQGYHYLGMFRTQAEVDSYLGKNPGYTLFNLAPKPGMLYYQDIRGIKDPLTNKYAAPDGKIDENDLDFITPKASNHYGFGLSLGGGYKGLKLDVVLAGAFGGQGSVEGSARKLGTSTSSRPAFWADHWTPENTDAAYPNPFYSATYDVSSEFWFESSFALRIRTANLSYGIPSDFMKKAGFTNLKVYVSAINPFNLYNPYSYRDNAGSFDTYPNLRTIAFGINAGL